MDVFLNNKISKLNTILSDVIDYGRLNFAIKQGYIIQPDGNEYSNSSYWDSGFISVSELSYYSVNFNTDIKYYDSNKALLSSGSANNSYFLTPLNTNYIRLFGLISNLPSIVGNMVLCKGTKVKNISDLTPQKINNELNIKQGYITQPDGNDYTNVNYYTTDFIKVNPGDIYSANFNATLRYYNSANTYVSYNSINNNSIKIPLGIYFVKITGSLTDLLNPVSNMVFVKGNQVLSAYDCPEKIKTKSLLNFQEQYWITGKTVAFYGDSITQQNYFEPYLNNKFNFWKYYNQGIGGTSIANNGKYSNVSADGLTVYNIDVPSDYTPTQGIVIPSNFVMQERIDLIPSDTEVLIVMGGTNDYGQNIAMGDFNTTPYSDATFCGAMMLMISRLKAKLPSAEIFICSPIYGNNSTGGNINLPYPNKNTLDFTVMDYGYNIKKACEISGVNYIPVGETSGIGYYNIVDNLQDGVHPQQATGALKIANAIFNTIKKYQPISSK